MSASPLTVANEDATDYSVPAWAKVTTLVLSLIGLALSVYLTITHFQPQALVCSGTGFIDCAKVTTSAQSEILGIPVAILGLANYTVMTAFNTPWAWRAKVTLGPRGADSRSASSRCASCCGCSTPS